MGLLDFLKPKVAIKEVSLEEAERLAIEGAAREEAALLDYASKKFAEVKHLLLSLSKSAEVLEGTAIELGTEGANERLRRVVVTAQKNLVRQLGGLSKKLAPPQAFDTSTVRSYSNDSLKAVNIGLLPYWKNIAFAKLLLSDEVKHVGDDLEELSRVFQALRDKAFSQKLEQMTVLKSSFESLRSMEKRERELYSAEREQSKVVAAAHDAVSGFESMLAELNSSNDAQRLHQLEADLDAVEKRKAAISDNFATLIAPVQRALKKMLSLKTGRPAMQLDEEKVAVLLVDSPSTVLAFDQNGAHTKSIVSKARSLVQDGAIKLGVKEREKKLAAMDAILAKDLFSEFFWELNKAQTEMVSLRGKLMSLGISKDVSRVKSDLESSRSRLVSEKVSLERLLGERQKLLVEKQRSIAALATRFSFAFSGSYSVRL